MDQRTSRAILATVASVLVLALGSTAGAAVLAGGSADESFEAWFVQLRTAPAAKGGGKAALASDRAAFFRAAAEQGLTVRLRHSFEELWNGVSVAIPTAQAGALAAVPGVEAVYPVVPVALPRAEPAGSSDLDLSFAKSMTGADVAHNELGLDGSGVKVAVMDSGLDYTLPEFGECAAVGPGCRVAGGFDFVGDDFDGNAANSTYQPVPRPDADPAPCDPNIADARALEPGAGTSAAAHGTHVAGIVGADGRGNPAELVTGLAPGATLYAYRVFGCNGSTASDVMIAAMERAAVDDVDVLNMSIGAAFNNFPNYPTAVAADNLVDAGTIVVASVGNNGDSGLWAAGAPGVAAKAIGVASVDNVKTFLPYFTASPDARHMGFNAATAAPASPTSGSLGLVQTGSPAVANDACAASPTAVREYAPGTFAGKAVLIRRGTCGFYNKALAAQRGGAAAVVLYNNAAGRISPTVAPVAPLTDQITIPVVAITAVDGAALSARIAARATALTWTSDSEFFDNTDTPGRTSSFSSWGTASDLTLKPDLTAPGGNIRSTWPRQQHNGHWVIGGTSMAAPHVAGAVALYLEARPAATPAAVRDALQNSASPITTSVTASTLDSTIRQGAGLLNVAGSVQQTTSVTPGKLSLGEGVGATRTITIRNNGGATKTYNLSFAHALSPLGVGTPFAFGATGNPGTIVSFSPASVTLAAGEAREVAATFSVPAALPNRTLYSGYVVLTNAASPADRLRVPYVGFKGDYQAIPALGHAGCALPLLARIGVAGDKIECSTPARTIDGLVGQPVGGTWAQPKQDPVVVLYHLDHQAAEVTLMLLNAATGEPFTTANRSAVLQRIDLHPRNSAATTFFAFTWDGTQAISHKTAQRKATPGGTYRLRITLTKVKAFNDSRPAGTETWTSPPITLRDS